MIRSINVLQTTKDMVLRIVPKAFIFLCKWLGLKGIFSDMFGQTQKES